MIALCPRCDCALVVLSWRRMDVDVCPRCHGVWLDHGELEDLLQTTGARVDDPLLAFQRADGTPSASSRKHLCPRCDQRLREVSADCGTGQAQAILVDKCPRGHGLWFDAGELKGLVQSFPPQCGTGGTVVALGEILGTAVAD